MYTPSIFQGEEQRKSSSSDSLSRNSYREIQQLYKQKRKELDMQLEKLGQSSGIQEVAVSIVLVGLRDF